MVATATLSLPGVVGGCSLTTGTILITRDVSSITLVTCDASSDTFTVSCLRSFAVMQYAILATFGAVLGTEFLS